VTFAGSKIDTSKMYNSSYKSRDNALLNAPIFFEFTSLPLLVEKSKIFVVDEQNFSTWVRSHGIGTATEICYI
jgi:hypothetical protein